MTSNPTLHHRRDIDGLRAVAVVPVVLFHGLGWPTGGFIGVDIFFVISGYLIGGIIQSEIDAGSFSIARFYERRVRRIFPALFVVLGFATVAAWFLLFPPEFAEFGKSLIATTLFASNILFWVDTDYFAPPAEAVPLLHTWSLAVEEQFYIVFPLVLILVRRFARHRLVAITAALAVLSFAVSVWSVVTAAPAAFYLPPSRAFELLLGALVAFDAFPRNGDRRLGEALSATGLVLIAVGLFALDADSPFPGAAALLPCGGAALLIHAGGGGAQTMAARLLSLGPLVFIGLISYSLYLWHWPIFVFYRAYAGGSAEAPVAIALAGLAGVAAYLSWRFVEQPWRRPGWRIGGTRLAGAAAGVTALFLAAGTAIDVSGGLPGRMPADIVALAAQAGQGEGHFRSGKCFLSGKWPNWRSFDKELCLHRSDRVPNYLLIGDSHGAHLWPGLSRAFPDLNFLQATASGCKPLLGGRGAERCTKVIDYALRKVLPEAGLAGLLISARWTPRDFPALERTIAYAKPLVKDVYVFGPIVEYRSALPYLLANAAYHGDPEMVDRQRLTVQEDIDRQLEKLVTNAGAHYVSTYRTICPDGACTTLVAPGVPLQFDYGHLSAAGSELVAGRWREQGLFP